MARLGIPGFGRDPLAYVDSRLSIVPVVSGNRQPTTSDTNYPLFCEWRIGANPLSGAEGDWWKLVNFVAGQAIWIQVSAGGAGPLVTLSDTAGTKVPTDALGNIQLEAGAGMSITSDPGNNKLVFALGGGGTAIDSIAVPAGTSPVVPDAAGQISFTVGSGLVITGGLNTMAFTLDGAVVGQTITGNTGGALSPTAGNWNILGVGDTSTSGAASTLSILSPTCATIIVDPTLNYGRYQTLTAALAAASSGDIIMMRPGTYSENVTIDKNISVVGWQDSNRIAGSVVISGKISLNSGITYKTSGISYSSNGDDNFDLSNDSAKIEMVNCKVSTETGVIAFNVSATTGASVFVDTCYLSGNGTAQLLANASSSGFFFHYCFIEGYTSTASTISSGSVNIRSSNCGAIFSTSNAGRLAAQSSQFGPQVTPYLNVTYLTSAGTGNQFISNCNFYSGTASALSIGTGTTLNINGSLVHSSNTNAVTGAGTIISDAITYAGTSRLNNVTTKSFMEFGDSGTFTPGLTFGGGSTGLTFSSQIGQYSRIGKLVWFAIQLVLTAKGTSTGTASITGLPFNSANTPGGSTINTVFPVSASNLTFTGQVNARCAGGGSAALALDNWASAGARASLTDAAFANNTLIQITGVYYAS